MYSYIDSDVGNVEEQCVGPWRPLVLFMQTRHETHAELPKLRSIASVAQGDPVVSAFDFDV